MTIAKKINLDTDGMFFEQTAYPITHVSMKPNLETNFYGTDNQEDFNINCKRLPDNWLYRTTPVNYKFNNSGLRMNKNLEEVNDDYIVGFGCSHTVGVGVNLEDTWIHKLAKELNLDYINSGISGGSVKLCTINFFNMLNVVKCLPKLVVFAWPSSVRYCFYTENEFVFYLPRFINENKKYQYHTEIYNNMLLSDTLTTEALFYRNMVKTTCNKLNIKFAEFTFDGFDQLIKHGVAPVYLDYDLKDLNEDYARDVRDKTNNLFFSHPGRRLHTMAKDIVKGQLNV